MRFWTFIGAILLASGVALGAYGAHGLRSIVEVPRQIEAFEYGVLYQLVGGLGFFAIAWATERFNTKLVNLAGILLLIGTIGFSLSLYLLIILHWRPYPLVTPISGVIMIAAWLVFALAALTKRS